MRFFAVVTSYDVTLDVYALGDTRLQFSKPATVEVPGGRQITLIMDAPTLGNLASRIGEQRGKAAALAIARGALSAAGLSVDDLRDG